MLEEQLAAYNIEEQEKLAQIHDLQRKITLRKKYVDVNDNEEEELDDDIVPTAEELVWVLGKGILYSCILGASMSTLKYCNLRWFIHHY